ncbi:MAG: glycosyltransferase [Bacteroidota bacterium]
MKQSSSPHIMILPSEPYVPAGNHMLGIFQKDQVALLKESGYRLSVLSVRGITRPGLAKSFMLRLSGRKRAFLSELNTLDLFILGVLSLFRISWQKKMQIDGVDVYKSFYVSRSPRMYDKKNFLRWVKVARKAFRKWGNIAGQPDLIHAHNAFFAGYTASTLQETFSVPYVLTEHSSAYGRKLVPDSFFPLIKKGIQNAQSLITVSPSLARDVESSFPEDAISFDWIPNVLDRRFEQAHILPNPDEGFRFICVGRMDENKNFQLVLNAFAEIAANNPQVSLDFVGTGPMEDVLKEHAISLELQGRVHFHGFMSRDKVVELMQSADCLVLSSNYETFGVVVIEAHALGKPTIATQCGGPDSIIQPHNGTLVPPRDLPAMAAAMQKMIHATHYESHAIRQQCLDRFGTEAIRQALVQQYQSVLQQQPAIPHA